MPSPLKFNQNASAYTEGDTGKSSGEIPFQDLDSEHRWLLPLHIDDLLPSDQAARTTVQTAAPVQIGIPPCVER